MEIKLTDAGKKRVVSILSSVLVTAQHAIENYIENTPAVSTDDPDIDFTHPECHLCIGSSPAIVDSLNNSFFSDSDEVILLLKPIMLFPVESPETAHNVAVTIAVAEYPQLVPDVLRPAVEKTLAQYSIVMPGTNHNFGICGYEYFRDDQYSYAPETHLTFAVIFRVRLEDTDYTPV